MTVLVGVLCNDGVVIGSDSAQTNSAGHIPTTASIGSKIDIIGKNIIIAHTGQVGMGQRFTNLVSEAWNRKEFKNQEALDTVRHMSALAHNDFGKTNAPNNSYGALVGFNLKAGFALCEFALADFQPEIKEDLWYCSMGSGQIVVDPLLALFRKAFWNDTRPSLSGGKLAVSWALDLAIEFCPNGVSGPIKLAVCDRSGARFIDDTEIETHRASASEAINHFGKFSESLEGDGDAAEVPRPQ